MVLCFPYGKPRHVAVEPNPSVLRMCLTDLDGPQPRRSKVDFQNISTPRLQSICDIDSVGDEHVVAFENNVSIELNSSKSIQAIECQDGDGAIIGVPNVR
jgi:hypothetical protein